MIEQGRVEFLEKKREEQFASVGRERAEVEAQMEQLEEEANGESIFEMLSKREIPLSQSPLPDELVLIDCLTFRMSPRGEEEEIEGAIEGIVPPAHEDELPGEVLTEADFIKAYKEKQDRDQFPSFNQSLQMPGMGNPQAAPEMNEDPHCMLYCVVVICSHDPRKR